MSDTNAAIATNDSDDERYRLLSIDSVATPAGCAGRDWFVYRIVQGVNSITGFRQGDRSTVGADVETIVAALNGRRDWKKGKSESKVRGRVAAAQARAAAAGGESKGAED
jgi:hypothetical protein